MGGVSTLAVAALATPALAQDAPIATAASAAAAAQAQPAASTSNSTPHTVEEVIVTGIRGSLQKSLNVKRQATGVVDAISAEDIGKFPDSNMAQAMERIPGVSVSYGSRQMGGTSTGEATQITVRGFGPSFNETLYDDRQISSALGDRSFDFSAVGSNFVQEIDILKTPDATLSSGAIGSTINIKFAKPLDRPGLHLSGTYSESYSPEDGHATPNGSVLFSDTFFGDTFGVLADFDYANLKTTSHHVTIQGWEGVKTVATGASGGIQQSSYAGTPPPVGSPNWFPQEYQILREQDTETRSDGRLAVQWRPESNVLITLNDDYSRDTVRQNLAGASWWFNSGSLQNITTNSHGTIINFDQPNSPTDFDDASNISVIETNETGLNVKWNVNEHFQVIVDGDHAESWLNPGGQTGRGVDIGYGPSAPGGTNGVNFGFAGVGPNSVPFPTSYGPGGVTSAFLDPHIYGSHVLTMGTQQNYDALNQAKLEGIWRDDSFRFRFGAQYVSDKEHLKNLSDFVNNDWQAYAGYGPNSNNPGGVAIPPAFLTQSFSTASFINGFGNTNGLPPRILTYSGAKVLNYLQGLGNPQTTNIPGAGKNCCTPPFTGIYQVALSPGSVQVVNEETAAIYADFNFKTDLAGMPLSVDFGAREEHTRAKSVGLQRLPVGPLTVQPSDHTAYLVTYAPGYSTLAEGNAYNYLLPNLDVNLTVLTNVKLRFDASRTLTRAPLGDLTPDFNIGTTRINALLASSGNPGLLPYLSDNLDLGAEWYYQKNSYASVDFFVKDITNFIQGGTSTTQFPGVTLPNGSPAVFTVSENVNAASYQVRGVELALQHVFGDTGFGFQANTTIVDTNKPFNPNALGTALAITGLADSANFVGFYDKHGFQARIAVNWRDNVLNGWGQAQNNSAFGVEPTFVATATHVDFSTSYDINSRLQVYFEALNLTDAIYQTYGRYSEQVLDAVDTGRRFNMGFHLKM